MDRHDSYCAHPDHLDVLVLLLPVYEGPLGSQKANLRGGQVGE